MGGKQCKETHILDNTTWLRDVINQHPKLKKNVKNFESFTIEPFISHSQRTPPLFLGALSLNHLSEEGKNNQNNDTDGIQEKSTSFGLDKPKTKNKLLYRLYTLNCVNGGNLGKSLNDNEDTGKEVSSNTVLELLDKEGIKHFKVTITYKNRKEKVQKLDWIVKTASCMKEKSHFLHESVKSLMQEIIVYEVLIAEFSRYLKQYSHRPQAKFLLNLPDFIFAEYDTLSYRDANVNIEPNKTNRKCSLVLEDICVGKRCNPVGNAQIATGLTLSEFKVFLATLAQIHAVGLSWQAKNDEAFIDITGIYFFWYKKYVSSY